MVKKRSKACKECAVAWDTVEEIAAAARKPRSLRSLTPWQSSLQLLPYAKES
jgi:hypothetical protein